VISKELNALGDSLRSILEGVKTYGARVGVHEPTKLRRATLPHKLGHELVEITPPCGASVGHAPRIGGLDRANDGAARVPILNISSVCVFVVTLNRGHISKPLPCGAILNADSEGAARSAEQDARIRLGPAIPPKV
jgi:hypothetical protein